MSGSNSAFLSTLSLRRATSVSKRADSYTMFSIHALLAESDWAAAVQAVSVPFFYPRSPCGERRLPLLCWIAPHCFLSTLSLRRATVCPYSLPPPYSFLSTLSLRRATHRWAVSTARTAVFYPRSPCGERRFRTAKTDCPCRFSIHALLAESDQRRKHFLYPTHRFSIHALLAESDFPKAWPPRARNFFYPRSPCGERPVLFPPFFCFAAFSIHALLAESDTAAHLRVVEVEHFLSTLSLRRATRSP